MTVSQWADKNRKLVSISSAEPGQWRTDRTPFLRDIMDDLTPNNGIPEVTFVKGVQIGGTECGNNFIGFVIDYAPGPIIHLMPTVDMAKLNSTTRIEPMIDASPKLREKIPQARSRDSQNTTLIKQFPNGVWASKGANSGAGLRSMPGRYVILDELDAYPQEVDDDGAPDKVAEKRATTFGARRKIYRVSTPLIESTSRIWKAFIASDQRHYHIPCPFCGGMQKIVWEHIKWPDGRPEDAYLKCIHCERHIEEHYKEQFLPLGVWIPENPSSKERGYHLSSLYSPYGWLSWAKVAMEFLAAKKNRSALQTWLNLNLGLPWVDKGESPDADLLYARRELYKRGTVPKPAVVLTLGVDVQKDRLEASVWAWAEGFESWLVDHIVIPCPKGEDTSGDAVWRELDRVVEREYPSGYGARMRVRMVAIDSGYNTMRVYNYVRNKPMDRFMAVRGNDILQQLLGMPKLVDINIDGMKLQNSVRLWPVGVSLAKSEFYGQLKQKPQALRTPEEGEQPDGVVHYYEVDREFLKQLTAEELQVKSTPKGTKYEWIKVYERNEPLDCRNYATAAAWALGLNTWDASYFAELRANLSLGDAQEASGEAPELVRRKSSYLER